MNLLQIEVVQILILNTTHDRETAGMTASAFVVSICDALNRKYCNDPCLSLQHKVSFAKEAIVDMLVTNVRVKSSTFLKLESEVHCVLLN
jgi:hypothetical protein